jgi:hypothetical protein
MPVNETIQKKMESKMSKLRCKDQLERMDVRKLP